MNYSVLLPRSVDFDTYALILDPPTPTSCQRPLILSLIQMLWDRGEPNGYAHRMTDEPLPNTPPHKVLMNVAFGDHQVTTWQSDVEARTIGAPAHVPVVDAGRWPGVDAPGACRGSRSYPFTGSAIVYWDSRPGAAGPGCRPATIGTAAAAREPAQPRRRGSARRPARGPGRAQMVSDFLRPDAQSAITDTCLGALLRGALYTRLQWLNRVSRHFLRQAREVLGLFGEGFKLLARVRR